MQRHSQGQRSRAPGIGKSVFGLGNSIWPVVATSPQGIGERGILIVAGQKPKRSTVPAHRVNKVADLLPRKKADQASHKGGWGQNHLRVNHRKQESMINNHMKGVFVRSPLISYRVAILASHTASYRQNKVGPWA